MLKKRMLGSLAVALTMIVPSAAGAVGSEDVMVPLRTVADQLGANLAWEASTATAALTQGDKALKVRIGSAQAVVGSEAVQASQAAVLQDDRTYVPLSLLIDALDRDLRWDALANRLMVGDLTGFEASAVANGSRAAYDLDLQMNEQHEFSVTAKVEVENVSQEKWEKVVMYFIPNVFTEAFKETDNVPKFIGPDGKPYLDINGNPLSASTEYGTAGIDQTTLNGTQTDYKLEYDTLTIPLANTLNPGQKAEIAVTYHFTLPEPGTRFSKEAENNIYKLAQWYPMLATYSNSRWNKEDYVPYSESYFTDFSDFTMRYDLPEGYSLVSSSESDPALGTSKGTVTANNVKEIYAQVFENPEFKMISKQVDGVEVRLFGMAGQADAMREGLAVAERSLRFYQQHIGPYPQRQLDIMMNDGGMEYPGIITASAELWPNIKDAFQETIAHEIAHQWFYGTVSSDPFHEGWLDEGLTELSTSLYMYSQEGMPEEQAFRGNRFRGNGQRVMSNTVVSQLKSGIGQALYFQPALKLWQIFKSNAGTENPVDTGMNFLRDYYEMYQYKQVNTEEFVRFAEAYFPLGRESYASWLNLK